MTPPPNRAYYEACAGRWLGEVELVITDRDSLARAPLSLADRARVWAMVQSRRLFGRARIDTSVTMLSDREVLHTTRLGQLGVPSFVSRELLELDPDGRTAQITIRQRFFPFFVPLRVEGPFPVTIDEDAKRASYALAFLGCALRQTGSWWTPTTSRWFKRRTGHVARSISSAFEDERIHGDARRGSRWPSCSLRPLPCFARACLRRWRWVRTASPRLLPRHLRMGWRSINCPLDSSAEAPRQRSVEARSSRRAVPRAAPRLSPGNLVRAVAASHRPAATGRGEYERSSHPPHARSLGPYERARRFPDRTRHGDARREALHRRRGCANGHCSHHDWNSLHGIRLRGWALSGLPEREERPWVWRVAVDSDEARVRGELVHVSAIAARFPETTIVPAHDVPGFADLPHLRR